MFIIYRGDHRQGGAGSRDAEVFTLAIFTYVIRKSGGGPGAGLIGFIYVKELYTQWALAGFEDAI